MSNVKRDKKPEKPDSIVADMPKITLTEADFYIDPSSGMMVFTKAYHLKRGQCCKSKCRHCPWEFRG